MGANLGVGNEDNDYGKNVVSWTSLSFSDDLARIKKIHCLNEAENFDLSLSFPCTCVCACVHISRHVSGGHRTTLDAPFFSNVGTGIEI